MPHSTVIPRDDASKLALLLHLLAHLPNYATLLVGFQGDHPVLHWKSNGTDALELEADHGTGTFSLLTIKMSPGYQDDTPLPPVGTAILWKYRAIYRIRDKQVRHWSQILEVGVKGG